MEVLQEAATEAVVLQQEAATAAEVQVAVAVDTAVVVLPEVADHQVEEDNIKT